MPIWEPITFVSSGFETNSTGTTWTVSSSQVITHEYQLINRSWRVSWSIAGTSISANTAFALRLNLTPIMGTKYRPTADTRAVFHYVDNGTFGTGFCYTPVPVFGGTPYIELYKRNVTAWSSSTNNTSIFGGMVFEATSSS